jgi:tripartite-type tricarboxylate transporter receptor subunit TctC
MIACTLVAARRRVLCGSGAWAQAVIKIVVPAPAGGAGDIMAAL